MKYGTYELDWVSDPKVSGIAVAYPENGFVVIADQEGSVVHVNIIFVPSEISGDTDNGNEVSLLEYKTERPEWICLTDYAILLSAWEEENKKEGDPPRWPIGPDLFTSMVFSDIIGLGGSPRQKTLAIQPRDGSAIVVNPKTMKIREGSGNRTLDNQTLWGGLAALKKLRLSFEQAKTEMELSGQWVPIALGLVRNTMGGRLAMRKFLNNR